MSDGGVGRGWLHQLFRKRAPAVSILIFVTQKLNDNFMQKILSCTSSWCNHPLPPHHLSSIFDSITDRVKKLYLKCMSMDIEFGNTEV